MYKNKSVEITNYPFSNHYLCVTYDTHKLCTRHLFTSINHELFLTCRYSICFVNLLHSTLKRNRFVKSLRSIFRRTHTLHSTFTLKVWSPFETLSPLLTSFWLNQLTETKWTTSTHGPRTTRGLRIRTRSNSPGHPIQNDEDVPKGVQSLQSQLLFHHKRFPNSSPRSCHYKQRYLYLCQRLSSDSRVVLNPLLIGSVSGMFKPVSTWVLDRSLHLLFDKSVRSRGGHRKIGLIMVLEWGVLFSHFILKGFIV